MKNIHDLPFPRACIRDRKYPYAEDCILCHSLGHASASSGRCANAMALLAVALSTHLCLSCIVPMRHVSESNKKFI